MVRDPNRGTEFGGTKGLIQPAPHEPTTAETLYQVYQTEPAPVINPGDKVDATVPTTSRAR